MGIDPLTLAIGSTLVSGFVSMSASQQATAAQAQQYENDRAVAEYNKQVSDQDRQANVQNAQIAQEDKDRENRRLLASLKAAYGGSGFEMAGSPLEVLQDTSIEMALDSRRMDYNTRVVNREGAEKVKAISQQAKDAERGIKNTLKAGRLSQVSAFLGTANKVGTTYYNAKNGTSI